jgi:hypothetical protein
MVALIDGLLFKFKNWFKLRGLIEWWCAEFVVTARSLAMRLLTELPIMHNQMIALQDPLYALRSGYECWNPNFWNIGHPGGHKKCRPKKKEPSDWAWEHQWIMDLPMLYWMCCGLPVTLPCWVRAHLACFNLSNSGMCHTCNTENHINHFILQCSLYTNQRREFCSNLENLSLPWNLVSALGGGDIPQKIRTAVIHQLGQYLLSCSMVNTLWKCPDADAQ